MGQHRGRVDLGRVSGQRIAVKIQESPEACKAADYAGVEPLAIRDADVVALCMTRRC